MYETAYADIYANLGATTRGTGEDTLDAMSRKRIDNIIQNVKSETYRWNPVRRTYIPKADGRKRPLGIPSGDDKLLQAAIKKLLETYYEPTFSDRSHGFRPGRGCHTALIQLKQKHKSKSWFIEGDIKGCFDNIDHDKLIEILAEKIKDGRLTRLIGNLLKAGYEEDGQTHRPNSGTPQGGIISPLLTNIYMDTFDKWVEAKLLPRFNRSRLTSTTDGRKYLARSRNPEHARLVKAARREYRKGNKSEATKLRKEAKRIPSIDIHDEDYRRLEYIRYADDFLLSFAGPESEAEEIKEEIRQFLKDELKLELSEKKTLITHARTEKAGFLGYNLRIMESRERRSSNGEV